MVAGSSFGENLARSLARADLKFKPGEFIALIVILVIVFGGVLWFVGGRNIVSLLIGVAAGCAAYVLCAARAGPPADQVWRSAARHDQLDG